MCIQYTGMYRSVSKYLYICPSGIMPSFSSSVMFGRSMTKGHRSVSDSKDCAQARCPTVYREAELGMALFEKGTLIY